MFGPIGIREGLGKGGIEEGNKKLRSLEFVTGVWKRVVEASGEWSKNLDPKNIIVPIKTERIIINISVLLFI